MNADKGVAHRDMLMMVHTTGLERTERQWADLLASVNPRLRILKVWKLPESPPGGFRVIEVLLETAEGARDVYKNAD